MLAFLLAIIFTIIVIKALTGLFAGTVLWIPILIGLIFCPLITLALVVFGLGFLLLPLIIIGAIVMVAKRQ